MKKVLIATALATIMATPALAVPTCPTWSTSCSYYTDGLATLIQLEPIDTSVSGDPAHYITFQEGQVQSLGMPEGIFYYNALRTAPEGVYNQNMTPIIVNSIKTLNTTVNGKANTSHTHAAGDITSGALSLARLPTIPASQTSGFAAVATSGSYNDLSNKPTIPSVTRTTSYPSLSLQTSTGAVGTQLSSTRDGVIRCSVTITTQISLSGNSTGYVVAEVAPTNSATAGDWVEAGRVTSGQTGTLVVGLTLNQLGGGQVSADVPAGYYAKFRSVNTNGTPSYTVNGCQQTLY